MSKTNQHLAEQTSGMVNPIDFSAATTFAGAVQLLIDAISKEGTDATDHRLFLDEMSPEARNSLYVILNALKTQMGTGGLGTQMIISSGVEFLGPDKTGTYSNGWTPTIVDGAVTVMLAS